MKKRIFLTSAMAVALAASAILLPSVADAAVWPHGGSHGHWHGGGRHFGGYYHGHGYHGGGYYAGGGYYGWGGYYGGFCGPIPNVLGFCAPLPFGL